MAETKMHGRQLAVGTVANDRLTTNPLARSNHTGTQVASTISDFNSATRAQVEAAIIAGSNVTITPGSTGATRTLTIDVSLPASGMTYKGTWNANTNSPTLSDGTGTAGDYYIVAVAGTTNLNGIVDWGVGDWVIRSSTGVWQKLDNSDLITSVFGRTGSITAQSGDYTASQITFTANGSIASTDVQGAIQEVRDESLQITKYLTDTSYSGSINGSNTSFVIGVSILTGSERLYLNGMRLKSGAGNDYTISGSTITFATAPFTNDVLIIDAITA